MCPSLRAHFHTAYLWLSSVWSQTLPLWLGSLFISEPGHQCDFWTSSVAQCLYRENRCVFNLVCLYCNFCSVACLSVCSSAVILHLICQDKKDAHMEQPPTAAVSPSFIKSPSISSSVYTFLASLIVSRLCYSPLLFVVPASILALTTVFFLRCYHFTIDHWLSISVLSGPFFWGLKDLKPKCRQK